MLRFCIGLGLGALASGAGAQSLLVDTTAIRFVGRACEGMSSQDIQLKQSTLVIDLRQVKALTPEQTKLLCLIKIPYGGSSRDVSLLLKGSYVLSKGAGVTLSWRIDPEGQIAAAEILSLRESPEGQLQWLRPLSITESDGEMRTLRISLFAELDVGGSVDSKVRLDWDSLTISPVTNRVL